jgi:Uma2 family endonuclease
MQHTLTRLTATEFMALEFDDPFIRQLLNGEIVLTNTPTPKHNRTSNRINYLLVRLIPSGEIVVAPTGLILTDIDVPQPDLFWVMEGGTCDEGPDGYYGAPALIAEVLSPSTAKRDRGYKFDLYESAGVPEYWIADADFEYIEVYTLVNGKYQRVGLFEKGEQFTSPVMGKEITVPSVE